MIDWLARTLITPRRIISIILLAATIGAGVAMVATS